MVKLKQAVYELIFSTPKRARPVALPPNYDGKYWDSPLGTYVNSRVDVEQVKSIKDSPKLDKPINLSQWVPEHPYYSNEKFMRELENYHNRLRDLRTELERYSGLLLVSGSGPIVDMVNNQRVHGLRRDGCAN